MNRFLISIVASFALVCSTVNAAVPSYVFGDGFKSMDRTKTWLLPAGSDTLAGIAATQTLTNKTMSGSSNTFSNIAYSSLLLGGNIVNADISSGALISNAKLATMAASTIKGNNGGSPAVPSDLTVAQVTAMLNAMVGDSGSGGTKGLVPAPASGDAAAGKVLKADGTWGAAGTSSPLTTNGDLYYYNSTNSRLPIGSSTNILNVSGGLPAWTAAPEVINGSTVKTSQSTIDINGQAQILSGTVDPSATATSAPIGSIYLNSSTGTAYRKTDAGSSTNWANLAVGAIAQASFYGSAEQPAAANCSFNESTSSSESNYVDLGTAGSCAQAWTTTGSISAVGATSSQITGTNMPAGSYYVTVSGLFLNSAGSPVCNFQLSDGTTPFGYTASSSGATASANNVSGPIQGVISYTTSGTHTFKIQASSSAASTCFIQNTATGRRMTWTVHYFPTQSQVVQPTAQTLDTLGQMNYVLGATCPSGSVAADGSAISRTTYAALFNRVGTTYGVGNGTTTFNVPDLRGIFVRGAGTSGTYTNANGVAYSGTLAAEQNDQMQGHVHPEQTNGGGGATNMPQNTAGSSAFQTTINTAGPVTDGTNGTPRTGVETRPANMSLTPCISNATMAMPVIANSVTSSSAGVERLERVEVTSACTSTPCTIASQSGSWLTSITRSSTGVYVLNFATAFSSPPTCRPTAVVGNNTNIFLNALTTTTTATIGVQTATSAAYADSAFNVTCMGPK